MIRRFAQIAIALAEDVEAEMSNMGEVNQHWAVFGGLIVVAFFAVLLAVDK